MDLHDLKLLRLSAQCLTGPRADCLSIASGLCGVQAQILKNAVHALRLRCGGVSLDGMVKTWTLRGTVHLLPERDLPLYIRFCGTAEDVCESGWYRWVASRGHALCTPERERFFAREAVAAIAAGCDEREQLRRHLQSLGMTEREEQHVFNGWGGLISELAGVGVIGFRLDMANEYHPVEQKRYRLLAPFTPLEEHAAQREIMRRYAAHYGPVTLRDAAYFTHWKQSDCRALLEEIGADTMRIGKTAYYALPSNSPAGDLPRVVLLAGFDPLMLGYRKEDNPFLPTEHLRGVFNLAGIVHPAILLDGRVVGRWKEKDGKVAFTLFETLRAGEKRLVAGAAEQLYPVRKIGWT